jgi:SAM-dependent methyltransferase
MNTQLSENLAELKRSIGNYGNVFARRKGALSRFEYLVKRVLRKLILRHLDQQREINQLILRVLEELITGARAQETPKASTAQHNLTASNGNGIRVVTSLSELDQIMQELDDAAAISDDELRRVFTTFKMEFPFDLPDDPYSKEYADRQFELYRYLRGESYHPSNEVTEFDPLTMADKPFPFCTESPQTVGNQLIAIGHIIRTLNLPPKSTILELGPGPGNTTIFLARMGYKVSTIDIEKRWLDLIAERARRKHLDVEMIHGDFSLIHDLGRQYDAVLFFECFHHCADHRSLIEGLKKVVAPGGKIVFAAEPITDDFPMPWGFRLDGESLRAIRRFGWCELGFQESYFRDLMDRYGWAVSKHVCAETPWGGIFVATRRGE